MAMSQLKVTPSSPYTAGRPSRSVVTEEPDDAHLMRLAGRFYRRVRAWAKAEGIPVIDCGRDVRKHRVAEEHLAAHDVGTGVFLILVARRQESRDSVHQGRQLLHRGWRPRWPGPDRRHLVDGGGCRATEIGRASCRERV